MHVKNVYGILVYVVAMVIKPLIVIQKCCWQFNTYMLRRNFKQHMNNWYYPNQLCTPKPMLLYLAVQTADLTCGSPHRWWPRVSPCIIQYSFTNLWRMEGWVNLADGGDWGICLYNLYVELNLAAQRLNHYTTAARSVF